MTTAYTPGLRVSRRCQHRAVRALPIPGEVVVEQGQFVEASAVIARAFLPGDITPLNVAHLLGVGPSELPAVLTKKPGEAIAQGELLARSNGFFGWFRREVLSPVSGTLESASIVTGQLMLRGHPRPVQVLAYLQGTVTEIDPGRGATIEADVSQIQGIFGLGGEAFGPIKLATATAAQPLTADCLSPDMAGCVVIGGARITAEAFQRAKEIGVAALVAGGIDDHDCRDILGYDLGVAVTGSEQIGLTLIITEGFGDIAMSDRSFQLFRSREGAQAAVNGATQIRAGVLRPEVIIPWPPGTDLPEDTHAVQSGLLQADAPVRMIRDPYFGQLGKVHDLPTEPAWLESGSKARVVTVRLGNGQMITVPRANIELIED